MHGFVLAFLSLALAGDPMELTRDVIVASTRTFRLPLSGDDSVDHFRFFVSEDRGKTWTHHKDYKLSDERIQFTAPRDGLYWFTTQIVFKDRWLNPACEGLRQQRAESTQGAEVLRGAGARS